MKTLFGPIEASQTMAPIPSQRIASCKVPHSDFGVADIPNAEKGFTLIFSRAPFPGHQYRLDWRRVESGGNWYYSADLDMESWLCPALFRYFSEAPAALYVQIKARA
jgi:hypothetical protein